MGTKRSPEEIAAKKAEAAARKAEAIKQSVDKQKTMGVRRENHERLQAERYQGVETLSSKMSPRSIYRAMGYGSDAEEHSNKDQMEIPGFKHPGRVENPTRWEDMHPQQQERIKRRAAEFGVTPESAHRSFGAQVDQSFMHEPRHESFYSSRGYDEEGTMRPAERIMTSAKENRVAPHVQAVTNAITSPKQHFSRTPKSGSFAGQKIYPNDMQATAAIDAAKAGTPEEARSVPGVGGFHGSVRKAAHVAEKAMQGVPVGEAWKPGDKTGPYHNAWVDPHGPDQFLVSDIHTGGGGFAPHLTIPEREKYLSIPGIHAFNDHVARNVMDERGLTSLPGTQSSQWSEERRRRNLEKERSATRNENPHQGAFF